MKSAFKLIFAVLLFFFLIFGYYFWDIILKDLPTPNFTEKQTISPSIRIVDRNFNTLYEILPEQSGKYTPIQFADFPKHIIAATIATEDVNFLDHPGFDLAGIVRAIWLNVSSGHIIAGGSTLTQQVVRNLLMDPDERNVQSMQRKIREILLAWKITRLYSKEEILTYYLNTTYYGAMAYGVEAAAGTYFGKSVSELDLAECALIAGLPQAPALYNPYTDSNAAKKRQLTVLDLMYKFGYIDIKEKVVASEERLIFTETPYPLEAPHFVMMVRNEIDRILPSLLLKNTLASSSNLITVTTLDLNQQRLGEESVRSQIEKLENINPGFGHNLNNAALVALNPNTGEITSLVGSPDYFDVDHQGAINMAITPRQPGSALKPIIYAAAMNPDNLDPWTAATMLLDVQTNFPTRDGKTFTPQNYDLLEHGPVSVRESLASSLNIPAVLTLEHIGINAFISLSMGMGISTIGDPDEYDLSLALGGGNVTLLELTSAYGAFANGGYGVNPYLIQAIQTDTGHVLYEHKPQTQTRVIDPSVAWLISDILNDDKSRSVGFGEHSILNIDRPAAVKTGTTTNFHDNWTIGYTPQIVAGVWAGNASYQPMQDITGLTGAAPVWHQFMRNALANYAKEWYAIPDNVIKLEICKLSGKLPTPDCLHKKTEWFIRGTEPKTYDTVYKRVSVDKYSLKMSDNQTNQNDIIDIIALDLPTTARNWVTKNGYMLYQDIQFDGISIPLRDKVEIFITSPPDNASYIISESVPLDFQSIKLVVQSNIQPIYINIYLDGDKIASLNSPPYETWWILQEGSHNIVAEAIIANNFILESSPISFTVYAP